MLCCSQVLTVPMFFSEQITEVRIIMHLLGLKVSPVTFLNKIEMCARRVRCCRELRAAVMSSAQANTFPSPGWTIVREKDQNRRSMPTLNKAPERGHP